MSEKTCTTHHHACDCREAEFLELAEENEQLKEENAIIAELRQALLDWDRDNEKKDARIFKLETALKAISELSGRGSAALASVMATTALFKTPGPFGCKCQDLAHHVAGDGCDECQKEKR